MKTRSHSLRQSQRSPNEQQPKRSNHPNQIITGIYIIVCEKTGDVYVGQSTSTLDRADQHASDLQSHKHSNYKLQALWDQHGARSFKLYLVQTCDKKDLNRLEAYWINKIGTLNLEKPKPPRFCFDARNRNKFLLNFSDLVKDSPKDKDKGRSKHSGCVTLLLLPFAILLTSVIAASFGFPWIAGAILGGIGWLIISSN